MNKRIRFFLIGVLGIVLISLFWSFREKIEDFLFFELTKQTIVKHKSLEEYYATFKPFRDWEAESIEIKAKAAASIEFSQNNQGKFLYSKNIEVPLPIASLTKLMTALIALENYNLEQSAIISEKAVKLEGNLSHLRVGESFYVKDLLYPLLMESNNGAAQALAEIIGEDEFIKLMNVKAQELNLKDTYFSNPIGLDPDFRDISPNYSTIKDLLILCQYLLKQPLIWEILKTQEFELYATDGTLNHRIQNNNELLASSGLDWQKRIIGGKTGHTPMAGECLILVLENPKNNSFIINIILGSEHRFEEMKKLTDWIYNAYRW